MSIGNVIFGTSGRDSGSYVKKLMQFFLCNVSV